MIWLKIYRLESPVFEYGDVLAELGCYKSLVALVS